VHKYNIFFINRNAMAEMELECWRREMRRRPQVISSTTTTSDQNRCLAHGRRNRTTRHGYRTRATRGDEQEDEEFEVNIYKLHIIKYYFLLVYLIHI
jgi:hypothetical protein